MVGHPDSLFGFRVYPIEPLIQVMRATPWMRRFDFDAEAVVRLCWRGIEPLNLAAHVRYFRAEEGGVSHFKYLRDNVLLTWMHARLFSSSSCDCRAARAALPQALRFRAMSDDASLRPAVRACPADR